MTLRKDFRQTHVFPGAASFFFEFLAFAQQTIWSCWANSIHIKLLKAAYEKQPLTNVAAVGRCRSSPLGFTWRSPWNCFTTCHSGALELRTAGDGGWKMLKGWFCLFLCFHVLFLKDCFCFSSFFPLFFENERTYLFSWNWSFVFHELTSDT